MCWLWAAPLDMPPPESSLVIDSPGVEFAVQGAAAAAGQKPGIEVCTLRWATSREGKRDRCRRIARPHGVVKCRAEPIGTIHSVEEESIELHIIVDICN